MLIGIDASRANYKHKSGVEWYAYYLIRHLARIDKNNEYILYADKPLTGGLSDLTKPDYAPYADICNSPGGWQEIKSPHGNFRAKILKWPFPYLWTQARLSLEMAVWHPDVLFIPSHTLPLIHPRASFVTIHDVAFEKEAKLYQREKMGPRRTLARRLVNLGVNIVTAGKYGADTLDYLRWSTRFGLKNARKVIAVSEYTKKDLVDIFSARPQSIEVVHNGYNAELFCGDLDPGRLPDILDKHGIRTPYLLYTGRIEKKKNIPLLIESFARYRALNPHSPHKLALVGDASYGYDEIKYTINELDLSNHVIMTGWVEEGDMPHIFNGADAFIFPSLYEGFGMPLLQAMACGTPVAASRATSIPEIVGNAALLFDPKDSNSMAEAIRRILHDAPLRRLLAERGRKRAGDFSWEKCARQTLAVLTPR